MKKFGDGQQPFHAIIDIPEGDSQELTTVTDQALNSLYGELFNLLQTHGINPTTTTNADLKQVARAVWAAVAAGNLFVDTGTANVKNLTHIRGGDFLYRNSNSNDNGFVIEFLNKAENTGAVTVNVFDVENNQNHFNSVPLVDANGNAFSAKALPANSMVKAYYDYANNRFIVINIYNLSMTDALVVNAENIALRNIIMQTVESIGDLAGLTKTNGRTVYVKSYYAGLGVGGGVFVYDANKSMVNNGGTVINGWVRQYTGSLNVLWFGARHDFQTGFDSAIAINKALAVSANIYFPAGNYIIHTPILSAKAGTVIAGDGAGVTMITVHNGHWKSAAYNGKTYNAAIAITSGTQEAWIENALIKDIALMGNSYSADGKIGIDFDNVCTGVTVENVLIVAFDKGIHTYKSWVHNYTGVTITDCVTNSMHLDTYANGFNMTGCLLYGKSIFTACHLLIENASYGNAFNGGAIEKANIGVSLKNSSQLFVSGVDFEVFGLLFFQQVECQALPSVITSCSLMGTPAQSGIATHNGNLKVENCKIFNPSGAMPATVFFATGQAGRLQINDNSIGSYSGKLIDGDAYIYGNDLGRLNFSKAVRTGDPKTLDNYNEVNSGTFAFYTSTGVTMPATSAAVKTTNVGNIVTMSVSALLPKSATVDGDYFLFPLTDNAKDGLVGNFAFSPSNDPLFRDGVFGTVCVNSGSAYLVKNSGGLLTKSSLNTSTDTNLFNINLRYHDNI